MKNEVDGWLIDRLRRSMDDVWAYSNVGCSTMFATQHTATLLPRSVAYLTEAYALLIPDFLRCYIILLIWSL